MVVHDVCRRTGVAPGAAGAEAAEVVSASRATASAVVTGPAAASVRTTGASRFASELSHGKFVSLIAARRSP